MGHRIGLPWSIICRAAIRAVFARGIPLVIYNAPYDLTLLDREARAQRERTQHVSYTGASAQVIPSMAALGVPASGSTLDLNVEIGRLADYHAKGILSDEEFAAGKKKLLGL